MAGTLVTMGSPITAAEAPGQPGARPPTPRNGATPPRPSQPPKAPVQSQAQQARDTSMSSRLDSLFATPTPAADGGSSEPVSVVSSAEPVTTSSGAPAAAPKKAEAPAADAQTFASSIPDAVLGLQDSAEPQAAAAPAKVEAPAAEEPTPEVLRGNTKAADAWKLWRKENRDLTNEVNTLKQQLEAAKKAESPDSEAAQLRQRNQELESAVGKLELTQTASFKRQYDEPLAAALREGVDMLVRTGAKPDAAQNLILKAARLSGDDFNAFVESQPQLVQAALMSTATRLTTLAGARDAAIKNWKETKAAQSVSESRDRAAALSASIERDTATAIAQVVKDGNFMFDAEPKGLTAEQLPVWKAKVQERVDALKGILRAAASTQGKESDLVRYIADGMTAPELRGELSKAMTHIRTLEKELKSRNSLVPKLGASEGGARAAASPSTGKPVSASNFVDTMFAGVR